MDLLNVGFALLIVKLAVSVLLIIGGVSYLVMQTEAKRTFRNKVCRMFFDSSRAVRFDKFDRIMQASSVAGILLGGLIGWFMVLSPIL